jgi:septal ring factor EnvC (AmiA/AmiB activator)
LLTLANLGGVSARFNGPVWLLALFCLFWLAGPGNAGEQPTPDEVEAELDALRGWISQVQAQIQALTVERDDSSARLEVAETEIGRTVAQIRGLDERINGQQEALVSLRDERRLGEEALATEQDALAQQVRAAYRAGRQDYLRLLLSQNDPATLGRLFGYYRYFSQARVRQIELVSGHIARLAALEEEIQREARALEELREQQQAERERLETGRSLRNLVLDDLKAQLANETTRLARLEQDRSQLEQLLKALRRVLTEAEGRLQLPDFGELAGRLDAPVAGPVQAGFGGNSRGWLMVADLGAPILAVAAGQVVFADWLRGFGLILILDHGQGWFSLYAHADSLFVELGDWVSAGTVLGGVGGSGGRTEPALYFEIRQDGEPVDPARFVRR